MKKTLFFLSLLSLVLVQAGCESYQDNDGMEQQQEREQDNQTARPIGPHEHGGGAGNK